MIHSHDISKNNPKIGACGRWLRSTPPHRPIAWQTAQRDLFSRIAPWPCRFRAEEGLRLIGLAVQHRGSEARYAGQLAIGPMDFRLPDLGALAKMEGPA